jgi:hypothetical protein
MSNFKKFLWLYLLIISCGEDKSLSLDLSQSPEQPALFGEDLISTNLYERDIAISPDGREIIYSLGNYRQTRRSLISIRKGAEGWEEKQIVSFSGRYQDIEPFFSTDGSKLYFASNRPMDSDTTRTDYNIWVVEKSDQDWKKPIPLDTLINTTNDEFYPAVSENGNLYFTATRVNGIGREDIFLSTFTNGSYQAPIPLDSTINTGVFEFNAYVSPGEDLLVFSSFGREDGFGGGDLYYSQKDDNGTWAEAKNLGETINSEKLDYCPFVDFPRGNFYFTSERAEVLDTDLKTVSEFNEEAHKVLNGMGNIYRVKLDALDLK